MQTVYCLPIIKNQKNEVLETVDNNLEDYSLFEVWLDYVDEVDATFIEKLTTQLGERLISVFRRHKLEPIQMELERRFEILKQIAGTPARVDLDITTQAVELNYIKEHSLTIKTIVSYHNYEQTPPTVQLEAIIDTMEQCQPMIYKVSAMCGRHEDALRLLQLLLKLKAQNIPVIILGMGELGIITRVFGALWGNEMTFAPTVATEQSAPGQLTKKQLEAIFRDLGEGK